MDDLFDDPGDLGFFDMEEPELPDEPEDDMFYEPLPGEGLDD